MGCNTCPGGGYAPQALPFGLSMQQLALIAVVGVGAWYIFLRK